MEPTIRCAKPAAGCSAAEQDVVRVRAGQEPRRGDIVVFETPERAMIECGAGGTYVKRIVALGGETFAQRRGAVFVDGTRLPEPYVRSNRLDAHSYPAQKIPPGHYFVVGDNRTQSCDSRIWGSLPAENVIGVVVEIRRGGKSIPVP